MKSLVPILCFGLCAASCGDSSSPESPPPGALTYWADVAPTLNDKCVKCHQPGGIGPFSMLTYQEVAPRAALIAAVTKARTMPPFLLTHDGSCGQVDDADALTDAEIDKLQKWASATLFEGARVKLSPPSPPALEGGQELRTPPIVPAAVGTPLALFDEYRCFPLETGLTRDQFITAYQVVPGQPAIVHHVIGFLVDPNKKTRSGPTNGEIMLALDAKDPDRPGWSCFGGPGEGIEDDSAPVWWAPGTGSVTYPDRIGIPQRPSDKLVVQIHYNLADDKNRGLMDQTAVRIRYADQVDRRAMMLGPDGLLETLFTKKNPDVLAPHEASVSYTWKKSMAEMGLGMAPPLEVMAVGPHMHERGRRSELRFLGAGGRNDCAARVEAWDFHWQRLYFFTGTRPMLTADSQIQLTCEYDTSHDDAPVLPGWGTRNEMCLDALLVALPPGM